MNEILNKIDEEIFNKAKMFSVKKTREVYVLLGDVRKILKEIILSEQKEKTNFDEITTLENIADVIFKTSLYEQEFCPNTKECKYGFDAEKENCLECIKAWLNQKAGEQHEQ